MDIFDNFRQLVLGAMRTVKVAHKVRMLFVFVLLLV